ncbi:hypothetical protein V5O48_007769 [Marasmius crinis-equi]|uniref:Uncharacterized protein n=1 Tax=Marasmius crinis-equi TaxID=585013 RepID=A0ABR3FGG1_9AGAR
MAGTTPVLNDLDELLSSPFPLPLHPVLLPTLKFEPRSSSLQAYLCDCITNAQGCALNILAGQQKRMQRVDDAAHGQLAYTGEKWRFHVPAEDKEYNRTSHGNPVSGTFVTFRFNGTSVQVRGTVRPRKTPAHISNFTFTLDTSPAETTFLGPPTDVVQYDQLLWSALAGLFRLYASDVGGYIRIDELEYDTNSDRVYVSNRNKELGFHIDRPSGGDISVGCSRSLLYWDWGLVVSSTAEKEKHKVRGSRPSAGSNSRKRPYFSL